MYNIRFSCICEYCEGLSIILRKKLHLVISMVKYIGIIFPGVEAALMQYAGPQEKFKGTNKYLPLLSPPSIPWVQRLEKFLGPMYGITFSPQAPWRNPGEREKKCPWPFDPCFPQLRRYSIPPTK
jgi:hypothetical protein